MALSWLALLISITSIYAQSNIKGCPDYPPIIPLDQSSFTPILDQINQFLANVTKTSNVPGLISTIVYDQQQIFTQGYGSRDVFNSSAPPPSGDDLVEIASITKTFTDLLLYYLRDNDQYNVNLNDPITKYLPTFSIKNPYNSNTIKLINLATQTSGVQREVPYPCSFSGTCTEAQVLQALSQQYLTLRPYTRFHYSNLGISLLGRAIEKVFCAGCYEQKIKELVLDKLGFSEYSGFNYSEYILDNFVAVGVAGYANNKPIKARVESLGFENPAGGMLANANDLAKLMMFMFRNNQTINDDKYQLLNGSTIEEIFKPKVLLRDGYQSIANPWEMEYREYNTQHTQLVQGVWYRGKEGELSGYRSSVVMVPEYKLGVFHSALISGVNDDDGHVWAYDVLDMLIPFVDNLLYTKGIGFTYQLPKNYELIVGHYVGPGFVGDITVVDGPEGTKYLKVTDNGGDELRLEVFRNEFNGEVFDETVLRAHNMDGSACRWLDDGEDQELMYFEFGNGNGQHATGAQFMGERFNYTGK